MNLLLTLVGPLLKKLVKPLGILLGALLAYKKGKKDATLESHSKVLQESKAAEKRKNDVNSSSSSDVADIVFDD